WHHAWVARRLSRAWPWQRMSGAQAPAGTPWWRKGGTLIAAALIAAMFIPVHLSVLAPGELVPAHPAVIRAPVDGVIGQFQVQPNQAVKAGQPLFNFDEAPIAAHQEMSAQALATAQAEYRQYAQQAVSDGKSKAQLAA